MKKQTIGLLLAGVLALSLLGATVLAAEGDISGPAGSAGQAEEVRDEEASAEVPAPEEGTREISRSWPSRRAWICWRRSTTTI